MENYIRKFNAKCKECNKEIYRRPRQLKNGPVFCSIYCSNKRFIVPNKICPVCNNTFKADGKRLRKTCSRKCSNIQRAGIKYDGSNLHNKYNQVRRLKTTLIQLRGDSCEICNYSDTRILQVHHIIEVAKGGTHNLDNLKLICPNCHCTIHYTSEE